MMSLRLKMIPISAPTPAQSHADAQRMIDHLERLLSGDGITNIDLVVIGARLRDALRARDTAARAMERERVAA